MKLTCTVLLALFFVACAYSGNIVPSGTEITVAGDQLYIVYPDGSSVIQHLPSSGAKLTRSKRAVEGVWNSLYSDGNYSYYSSEWTVPPKPTRVGNQFMYFTNAMWPKAEDGYLQTTLTYQDDAPAWHVESWYVAKNGGYTKTVHTSVQPGARIKGEIYLNGTANWVSNMYVNGVLVSTLKVNFVFNVYVNFPAYSTGDYVMGTNSELAAQSYVVAKKFNASVPSAGRLFQFTTDGYVRLAANNNLVLDVDGGIAKEGARVLVYAQKTPVASNQKWGLSLGRICSNLNGAFCLNVNATNGQIVITKNLPPTWQSPVIGYKGPGQPVESGLGFCGSVELSVQSGSLNNTCSSYPPSNRLDVQNIVLKKASQQVSPAWYNSFTPGTCAITLSSSSPANATIYWNSTAA